MHDCGGGSISIIYRFKRFLLPSLQATSYSELQLRLERRTEERERGRRERDGERGMEREGERGRADAEKEEVKRQPSER